ncbi:GyrI-like domain-containing protein [Microbacterium luticocti]|uniref:GyrI-like domain-containing protein n=1 Tax=Microbacterium luticocti TaxID=451764 RepID=UPI0003F585CC|nr:GyrI-like domain-containing protein [Microbacterium luticocti]
MTETVFPPEPFDGIVRLDLDAAPLAVIRRTGITVAQLNEVFDHGFTALGSLFAAGTLTPAGPPVAVYRGDPSQTFDLELGFPVVSAPSKPIEVDGLTVEASALPEGLAVATTYVGDYDGLGAAWGALVAGSGAQPIGIWIESYVTDPRSGAVPLRTDLIMPTR